MDSSESTTDRFALDLQYHTIQGEFVQTVDARTLHRRLGIATNFSLWITRRIEDYQFVRESDYLVLCNSEENPQGGRPLREYLLTVDMAKELCMVERTPLGRQARAYFIACEKTLGRMGAIVAQRLEQLDERLSALEAAQRPPPQVDQLTQHGHLPAPVPRIKEHAEVSWHLAAVWSLLQRSGECLTNYEIAQRTGIARRTASAHTRYLLQLGMLEVHETFPRHLYVFSASAEQRNAGVYHRLQRLTEVIQARHAL
jgi:phage anti-repressor protein